MKDSLHRSYDYFPTVSKKEQNWAELLNEIMCFIKNTKLKKEDWFLLNKLMRNLELNKQSSKVLRSIKEKFIKVQKHYQK